MQVNTKNQQSIPTLPSEILMYIFDFLDEQTLRTLQVVSKVFYQIASEDSKWRKFVDKHLGLTLGDFRGTNYTYEYTPDIFGAPMITKMSRKLTPDMPIHQQFIEYEKQYYRFFRTIFSLEQSETKFNIKKFIKNDPQVTKNSLKNCIIKDIHQRELEKKYDCPQRGNSLELGFLLYAGIKPTLENIQEALVHKSSLFIMNLLLKKIDEIDRENVKILLLHSPFTTVEILKTAIKNGYLFYESDLKAYDMNDVMLNYLKKHALPNPDPEEEYNETSDADEWGGTVEFFQDPRVSFTSICGIL